MVRPRPGPARLHHARRARRRGGRVRPVRFRQVDAHQDRQRPRTLPAGRDQGGRHVRRRPGHPSARAARAHRHGVPEFRAVPAPVRARQPDARAGQGAEAVARRGDREWPQLSGARRPAGAPAQVSGAAVRRPAAARGDRAGAGDGPGRDAVRRTHVRARSGNGGRGPRRDDGPRAGRHDDDGRDPRDGVCAPGGGPRRVHGRGADRGGQRWRGVAQHEARAARDQHDPHRLLDPLRRQPPVQPVADVQPAERERQQRDGQQRQRAVAIQPGAREQHEPCDGAEEQHAADRGAQRQLVVQAAREEDRVERPAGTEQRREHAADDAERPGPRGRQWPRRAAHEQAPGRIAQDEYAEDDQQQPFRRPHEGKDADRHPGHHERDQPQGFAPVDEAAVLQAQQQARDEVEHEHQRHRRAQRNEQHEQRHRRHGRAEPGEAEHRIAEHDDERQLGEREQIERHGRDSSANGYFVLYCNVSYAANNACRQWDLLVKCRGSQSESRHVHHRIPRHPHHHPPRRLAPAPARRRGHGQRAAAQRAPVRPRHRHAEPEAARHDGRAGRRIPRAHPGRAAARRELRAADDAVPDRQYGTGRDPPRPRHRLHPRREAVPGRCHDEFRRRRDGFAQVLQDAGSDAGTGHAAADARRSDGPAHRPVRPRSRVHRARDASAAPRLPGTADRVRAHHDEGCGRVRGRGRRPDRRDDHGASPAVQPQRDLQGRHPPALLLPARAEARRTPPGAGDGRHERRRALFPRHRLRAARRAHERSQLRLRRLLHGAARDGTVRRRLRAGRRAR
ncbi:hypothetical protein Lal_00014933 [Lupinus albus]|nr:hypothetical protein Lal_00014933 [Lupinus albus]